MTKQNWSWMYHPISIFDIDQHHNEVFDGTRWLTYNNVECGHHKEHPTMRLIHIAEKSAMTRHNGGPVNFWEASKYFDFPRKFYVRRYAGESEKRTYPDDNCYCDKCKMQYILHDAMFLVDKPTTNPHSDYNQREFWREMQNKNKYPWEFEERNELTRPKCKLEFDWAFNPSPNCPIDRGHS